MVGGRCLEHEVLPAGSLVERTAFLMKGEVGKLWNKYPKVKVCLNKCEISDSGTTLEFSCSRTVMANL